MYLESFVRVIAGKETATRPSQHWAFADGRCGAVSMAGRPIGYVGEMNPAAVSSFQVGVPVSGFEIRLAPIYERLK